MNQNKVRAAVSNLLQIAHDLHRHDSLLSYDLEKNIKKIASEFEWLVDEDLLEDVEGGEVGSDLVEKFKKLRMVFTSYLNEVGKLLEEEDLKVIEEQTDKLKKDFEGKIPKGFGKHWISSRLAGDKEIFEKAYDSLEKMTGKVKNDLDNLKKSPNKDLLEKLWENIKEMVDSIDDVIKGLEYIK